MVEASICHLNSSTAPTLVWFLIMLASTTARSPDRSSCFHFHPPVCSLHSTQRNPLLKTVWSLTLRSDKKPKFSSWSTEPSRIGPGQPHHLPHQLLQPPSWHIPASVPLHCFFSLPGMLFSTTHYSSLSLHSGLCLNATVRNVFPDHGIKKSPTSHSCNGISCPHNTHF